MMFCVIIMSTPRPSWKPPAVNAVATPIELQPGLSVQVGASIGMAGFPHHAADAESLRAAADAAMYAVKRAGRNGYAVYALNGRHRVRLQGGR